MEGKDRDPRDDFPISWKEVIPPRKIYHRLVRLKGQPEEVAGGVAIGVFVGITPTVPFHTLLTMGISLLARKSKLAALLGSVIANPFTLPLIYFLDFRIGAFLIGSEAPWVAFSTFSFPQMLKLGTHLIIPLVLGGVVLGAALSIPAYFIARRLVVVYRKEKQKWIEMHKR